LCPFIIGDVLYPSISADKFEIEIMNVMEELMNAGHEDERSKTFRINMLQCVVSPVSYCCGLHDDTSPLLNRNQYDERPSTFDFPKMGDHEVSLPHPAEQQTITIVFCEGERKNTHVIQWFFGKDFEHLSGEYVLGHSCIHIQTQGSQYGLKHKVIFDELSGFPPKWRMVLTGRLCGSLKEIKQSKRYLNTRLQYEGIQQ
jgi:hypothetical protein